MLWPTSFVHTEMLPVECSIVDWRRVAVLGPLYSLASLYKLAKARHRLGESCLNNKGAEHPCPSSCWIGRKTDDPFLNDINPQITPPSPLQMASCHGASNSHIFPHHVENPPSQLANFKKVGGGRYEWRRGLAHFHNEYSFLMISPKLYDISLFFLLIPSPLWTAHLLILIRLLGDGYSLLGSQK